MSAGTLPALLEGLAAARPDAAALVSLSRPPLGRAAFAAQARRVAEGLARQGVGPGDRVALLLPNRPEFLVLLLALARLGATAVPLDPAWGWRRSRPCSPAPVRWPWRWAGAAMARCRAACRRRWLWHARPCAA
ncbi:AMP-binding protein [Pseudoroseomonas wenyumeiae]